MTLLEGWMKEFPTPEDYPMRILSRREMIRRNVLQRRFWAARGLGRWPNRSRAVHRAMRKLGR